MTALALLLSLSSAFAAAPQEGASSGACGMKPPFTTRQQTDHVYRVFKAVKILSGIKAPVFIGVLPTSSEPNAVALTKAMVKKDYGIDIEEETAVMFDLPFCDFVHSDDELASTLAHELGHLILDHPDKKALLAQETRKALAGPEAGRMKAMDRYYTLSRQWELDADKEGVRMLSRAGSPFSPYKGAASYRHYAAVKKYLGLAEDDPWDDHPSPKQRETMEKFWSSVYSVKP